MKIAKYLVLGSFETIFPIFVNISVIISYIMIYLAVKGLIARNNSCDKTITSDRSVRTCWNASRYFL